jgi:hypothetical protein
VSSGNVTPLKLVGHLRGRSWHERDAFAGRPKKNVLVVPVVSSFVWIAAACCCALRRRRQQRRLSGKGLVVLWLFRCLSGVDGSRAPRA